MKTPSLLILALVTVSFYAPSSSIAADQPPRTEQVLANPEITGAIAVIDAYLEGVQIYEKIPGMSAGIVHDQTLIWQRGYGHSNLETKRPADADTLYSICSISKLFTAVGIMQLRDAGKLILSDPVGNHLDWFDIEQAHDESGPVTIESLLTHSSGLPRESDYPYWNGPDFPFPTRAQVIDRLSDQETLYPAQRYFQYSNLALTLAGEVIQERSGRDYSEYINQNILEPLGLADTRTYYPEDLRGEQLAIGYTGMHRSGTRDPVAPFFTRGITAAAGFTSSVNDLAKFASWQFRLLADGDDDVLSANTLREMHRVHWVDPDWETTWGIGFNVRREDGLSIVSHGGGCPGYITQFALVPKRKIGAIVLTNAGDGPASRMAMNILKTIESVLDDEDDGPSLDVVPDYSMYEGNYEVRPWGGEVAVRQWGDELAVIDIPGEDLEDAMIKLEYDGDHTFTRLTDDDERREPWVFEVGSDGKAERIYRHSIYMNRID
jgi:CubicO group peptidase (beta-lactamase class C family)